MVGWSRLLSPAAKFASYRAVLQEPACRNALQQQLRRMGGDHGHHQMIIKPSRFQWDKFKDLIHFYVMLGVIPVTALVLYANIFVGPAQLAEIPEGYEPKHWEYEKHPITRFISRYILNSEQQNYEKSLHYLYEENEKAQIRLLEDEVRRKMSERNDYQAYYYRPSVAKYHRISKEAADELEALRGD
ncbi:NADH dehydrogenase [ubiquinone] 1 beta subcomplex subunit 5, mitochondrial [Drosophila sechellia]|uniref:NADH dehydrogenase [ubiquinone] 1 beta subcomplex subunit 5, mitochondrial n=1 Tax=Drosophila sechellia TaxID=7238 RepID=B4HFJ1_DROSE|nr:NADH dehydrogenase [ubiquinone] 1 beta subcomplex subunit 5, mitochondrial [Drosophila sechellia]EDW41222.1 GM24678 [Drosophila sechellia]